MYFFILSSDIKILSICVCGQPAKLCLPRHQVAYQQAPTYHDRKLPSEKLGNHLQPRTAINT